MANTYEKMGLFALQELVRTPEGMSLPVGFLEGLIAAKLEKQKKTAEAQASSRERLEKHPDMIAAKATLHRLQALGEEAQRVMTDTTISKADQKIRIAQLKEESKSIMAQMKDRAKDARTRRHAEILLERADVEKVRAALKDDPSS